MKIATSQFDHISKKGLVLEGGAMRGLWTAGITDVMMEHDVWPDGLIGVSAGAAFGCNYKSRQVGRAIRYNTRFAHDARYSGMRSLLTSGDYYNADFGYHVIPKKYDIFDDNAFNQNPMTFTVVCTDVETGQAVYKRLDHVDQNTYDWIRASASMPLVSKVVELEGYHLLDGGVSDSIPLEYFEQQGYERNVVILTQPLGYQKEHNKLMPLMRLSLRKYPNMIRALDERHMMYNRQLAYVAQAEQEGRCLVIRPDGPIPIGHISHNPAQMRRVYETGRAVGERYIEKIKAFYEN
jgi:predicted patatin/cPLA2 family phospholipase